jgi:hypothetical protein
MILLGTFLSIIIFGTKGKADHTIHKLHDNIHYRLNASMITVSQLPNLFFIKPTWYDSVSFVAIRKMLFSREAVNLLNTKTATTINLDDFAKLLY